MSIEPSTLVPSDPDSFPETTTQLSPVVVRRNAGLSALVGAAASAIAIAYLWRATETAAVLDWVLCVVLAAIAVLHLVQLVDARTPLLVADELGVRIRFGHQWRGLPWDAIGSAGVRPRHGLVRDGRLMFAPHSLGRALEGLDARGRRAAALNQKLYGAALAVPMGLTTRVSHRQDSLVESLAELSQGRTNVIVLEPAETEPDTDHGPEADGQLVEEPTGATVVDWPAATDDGRSIEAATGDDVRTDEGLVGEDAEDAEDSQDYSAGSDDAAVRPRRGLGALATMVSRLGRGRSRDVDVAAPDAETSQDGDRLDEDPVWAVDEDSTADAPDPAQDEVEVDRFAPGPRMTGDEADDQPGLDPAQGAGEAAEDVEDVQDAEDAEDVEDDEDDPDAALEEGLPLGETDEPVTGGDPDDEQRARPQVAARGARALGGARRVLRAQIGRGESAATLGNAALLPDRKRSRRRAELPETEHLRRPGDPDLEAGLADLAGDGSQPLDPAGSMVTVRHPEGVRPIATLHHPVDPLVVDEFVTEPAYDPVIGPELAAARHRTGLSVDQLAERTRIRPHVIESIEVDDFAPCGGDFYARGHLRTLARVLGRDPEKLLALYDQRYATAPINARRVFEAELATGMTGSVRRAGGGPNWALLIGVVLALVMVWGVVRLFASEPQEQLQPPVPALNGSAGVDGDAKQQPSPNPAAEAAPKPVELRLTAAHAATHVIVRDRSGKVVWVGDLALGQSHSQRVTPPAKVHADDAGALDVSVGGHFQGRLGTLGQPGQRSFGRP